MMRVTAELKSTFGAASCWPAMSMPDATRMWFDSFWPFAGSRTRNSIKPTGMPTRPTSSDHRQFPVTAATVVITRTPIVCASGSEMLRSAKTRARASVGYASAR